MHIRVLNRIECRGGGFSQRRFYEEIIDELSHEYEV